jgi:hypothetical protein
VAFGNFGVPTVVGPKYKTILWVSGIALFPVAVAIFFIVVIFFRPIETDTIVEQKASPNGKFIAKIHKHFPGGDRLPTLDVFIESTMPSMYVLGKVYSRNYDCNDYTGFHVEWTGTNELTIYYGECDVGAFRSKEDDTIWEMDDKWGGVGIRYRDTKYLATH